MSSADLHSQVWPWTLPKAKVLLDDEEESVNVRISDIAQGYFESTTYSSAADARTALSSNGQEEARIRIIDIYSINTISPLQITNQLLKQIFKTYNVHHNFANVVASFGYEPNKAEGSCNNMTISKSSPDQIETSYQIRYVEENHRSKLDPWSLRHSGIYHLHRPDKLRDIFILLHPVSDPGIGRRINMLDQDKTCRELLCSNPHLLHTWIFDQYLDNWRWYYRHLDERFAEENDLAMVMKPERAEPKATFKRVKSLRNTNDFIIFAQACCAGNLDLIHRLGESQVSLLRGIDDLNTHASKMKGYVESGNVLKGRVQNLIDLVGYTLTLHNQMEAAKVQLEAAKIDSELRDLTEGIKKLGEQSVDDSATVKIVTFVSAIYLPGSFIATLYGMNFFLLHPDSKRFQVSPDFWIFVMTWIPLTLITGGMYVLFLYLHAKRRGKRFRWPWETK